MSNYEECKGLLRDSNALVKDQAARLWDHIKMFVISIDVLFTTYAIIFVNFIRGWEDD